MACSSMFYHETISWYDIQSGQQNVTVPGYHWVGR